MLQNFIRHVWIVPSSETLPSSSDCSDEKIWNRVRSVQVPRLLLISDAFVNAFYTKLFADDISSQLWEAFAIDIIQRKQWA